MCKAFYTQHGLSDLSVTSDRFWGILEHIVVAAIIASGAWLFIAVALDPIPHKTLYEIGGTIGAVAGYVIAELVRHFRN